jgi:hypothetical protein
MSLGFNEPPWHATGGAATERPAPRAEWAAAVIASRESVATLLSTLAALVRAATRPLTVDLVINGNAALARDCAAALQQRPAHGLASVRVRVWALEPGDKAHAINTYVHRIWPGAPVTFFVDGYARVRPDALQLLAATLARHEPEALAAAALPTSGRGAAAVTADLHRHGGLHGNFFALGAPALQTMRELAFRLPLGLYRVDSTLAAALAFRLRPQQFEWAVKRNIVFDTEARWDVDAVPWWQPATWRANARRRMRQAQGDLENWAVRHWLLLNRRPVQGLAPTVEALVEGWAAEDPAGLVERLHRRPLRQLAWRRLRRAPIRPGSSELPRLLIDV